MRIAAVFTDKIRKNDLGGIIMEYNEEYFAQSANRKAMAIWATIASVLSAAYVLEFVKGSRTIGYLCTFLAFC